jgi:hypothetical protein
MVLSLRRGLGFRMVMAVDFTKTLPVNLVESKNSFFVTDSVDELNQG